MPRKPKSKQRRALNKKPAFLAAIAETGSITEAAALVKINRSIHYDWKKLDPEYPARFAEAMAKGDDALEDEVTARAKTGVFAPTIFQGRFSYPQELYPVYPQESYEVAPAVPAGDWKDLNPAPGVPAVWGFRDVPGSVPEMKLRDIPGSSPIGTWVKSDALLMFRQRGRFAKYRQNFTEVTGKDGGPIAATLTVKFVRPKAADKKPE